jgi:hypothetical protein
VNTRPLRKLLTPAKCKTVNCALRGGKKINPTDCNSVSFYFRDREKGVVGKGGRGERQKSREAEVPCSDGTCKTRPRKKEGARCSVTRLPSRHVAQRPRRCQKNLALSRSRSAARNTRARVAATHARAPARAVGRRNGGSNPERFSSDRSPHPRAFPTLLSLYPNMRPLLPCFPPSPGSLKLRVPKPKVFLTRNVFANPGLFPPHNSIASPPPPPFAVCQALSENTAPTPRPFCPSFCLTPTPPSLSTSERN